MSLVTNLHIVFTVRRLVATFMFSIQRVTVNRSDTYSVYVTRLSLIFKHLVSSSSISLCVWCPSRKESSNSLESLDQNMSADTAKAWNPPALITVCVCVFVTNNVLNTRYYIIRHVGSSVEATWVPAADGSRMETEWKVLLLSYSIENLLSPICHSVSRHLNHYHNIQWVSFWYTDAMQKI